MTAAIVCTLILRAVIDRRPVAVYRCECPKIEYIIQRASWDPPKNCPSRSVKR